VKLLIILMYVQHLLMFKYLLIIWGINILMPEMLIAGAHHTVSGFFIADSAYQYIAIGNFFDDSNTDTSSVGSSSNVQIGYYFIDDVWVSEVKDSTECGEVFIPTAFSPNKDGNNDLECVFGNCIQSMVFKIYNRWGEMVFESTEPATCWDGTYKGKELNTGVFVYYLNATLTTGEVITKKGNLSLFR
jgi:gliding motility-associated-like protein